MIFQINNLKINKEEFIDVSLSPTTLSTVVAAQVKKVYKDDIESIQNLSIIAKGLTQNNGYNVVGGLTISGVLSVANTQINNNLTISGTINGINITAMNNTLQNLTTAATRILNDLNLQVSQDVQTKFNSQASVQQESAQQASQLAAIARASQIVTDARGSQLAATARASQLVTDRQASQASQAVVDARASQLAVTARASQLVTDARASQLAATARASQLVTDVRASQASQAVVNAQASTVRTSQASQAAVSQASQNMLNTQINYNLQNYTRLVGNSTYDTTSLVLGAPVYYLSSGSTFVLPPLSFNQTQASSISLSQTNATPPSLLSDGTYLISSQNYTNYQNKLWNDNHSFILDTSGITLPFVTAWYYSSDIPGKITIILNSIRYIFNVSSCQNTNNAIRIIIDINKNICITLIPINSLGNNRLT